MLVEGTARLASRGKKLDLCPVSILLICVSFLGRTVVSPLWTSYLWAPIKLLRQLSPTLRQTIPGRFAFTTMADFGHALTLGGEFQKSVGRLHREIPWF